jgi:hypothetical protein
LADATLLVGHAFLWDRFGFAKPSGKSRRIRTGKSARNSDLGHEYLFSSTERSAFTGVHLAKRVGVAINEQIGPHVAKAEGRGT